MKRCAHCKISKDESEFAWSNKLLGIRQKHCRDCMRKFNRQSYERRSEEKKEQVKEDRYKKLREAQQYIWDYLSSHPCIDCGNSNPVVLEFDHIKGNKRASIADMPRQGYSIASIQKEIGKCVVRCANCHRERTAKDRGWFRGN